MNLTNFWDRIINADLPVVLYGTGNGADKLIDKLQDLNVDISGIFASDGFVRKRNFRGFEVCSFDEIKRQFPHFIVLLAFGSDRVEVLGNIKKIMSECEFYAPYIPLFENEFPSETYLKENEEDISRVYRLLVDETSRRVFECVLKYRHTAKPDYLFDCETEIAEAYQNILKLSSDEIFFDVGAYRGDTAAEFMSFAGDYKKIYACEPNIKTFRKLEEYARSQKNMECVNCFVSNENSFVYFDFKHGRGSCAASLGDKIKTQTVDSLLNEGPVSFIKVDSEGEEKNVIEGAKNTILNYRPKLRIAAYHRPCDIIDIPKQVLSIRSDYKLYLRHNPAVPDWNTDYYFV